MTKEQRESKVSEAAVAYIADRRNETSVTTISSKNQITLPVQLLRELGLGPGDRLAIEREDGRLVLRPRPRDWVSHYAGSLPGLYGPDPDAYLRETRAGMDRDELEDAPGADAR